MTTSDLCIPRLAWACNLFERNDVVNLSAPKRGLRGELAALSVIGEVVELEKRNDIMWGCYDSAVSLLSRAFSSNHVWICACYWGRESRVTRRRGLLGGLRALGISLTSVPSSAEIVVERADNVYFYGAFDIGSWDARVVRELVTPPAARSFLVSLPHGVVPDITALTDMGWYHGVDDLTELRELAIVIANQNGILFRFFGAFDDLETGVDCIMDPGIYEYLRKMP